MWFGKLCREPRYPLAVCVRLVRLPIVRSCLLLALLWLAMRAPEMSYSPAYHQGRDSLRTAPSTRSPEPTHTSSPSEWTGFDVSPRPSGPRGTHPYSPEASSRQSRVDDETAATRVVASPSPAHKEERSRGSWADRPSLMSGDHSSSSRTHKRSVPEAAPVDDSHDALLMLVSPDILEPTSVVASNTHRLFL